MLHEKPLYWLDRIVLYQQKALLWVREQKWDEKKWKKIFAAFWWFKLAWYFLLLFSQKFPCSVRRTFLFVFVQVTEPVSESSSLLSTSSINNHPPKNARFTHRSIPLAAWQRGLPREKGMSQGPQAAFQYTERELKEKHHSMTHHSPKYFSTDPPAAVTFWNTVISQKHYFWVGFKHAWYFFTSWSML